MPKANVWLLTETLFATGVFFYKLKNSRNQIMKTTCGKMYKQLVLENNYYLTGLILR